MALNVPFDPTLICWLWSSVAVLFKITPADCCKVQQIPCQQAKCQKGKHGEEMRKDVSKNSLTYSSRCSKHIPPWFTSLYIASRTDQNALPTSLAWLLLQQVAAQLPLQHDDARRYSLQPDQFCGFYGCFAKGHSESTVFSMYYTCHIGRPIVHWSFEISIHERWVHYFNLSVKV